jgi:subtilisin family serine protease
MASGTVIGGPPDPAGQTRWASATGSWIVTVAPGIDPQQRADGIARRAGGGAAMVFRWALQGFVFRGSAAAAAALARDPEVRTVVADRPVHAVAETLPVGLQRIDASHPTQADAHDSGFTGSGARIAILDTGVDLSHPDLVANLDVALGKNCYSSGPPHDGHGHGTHVAGTAAAVANTIGVIGVAPQARIAPIKVLSDKGSGEWSNVICGIDHLTGLALDGDPSNDVRVANMSLGDTGSPGSCLDGGLREAICRSTAAGITYIAAAGNSSVDASTFVPAAFPEVVTVSATVHLDGEPGGLAGCDFAIFYCDDTLAEFSNHGAVVDVTAPGYDVYSTWKAGGYRYESGTSMAAPHVAGVAALLLAARPDLGPADVEALLEATGECPNGQWVDAGATPDCAGQGQWGNDPDGIGEPLVNALRAAQAAAGWDAVPRVSLTNPSQGDVVSGAVSVTAEASDDVAVTAVEFRVNGKLLSVDTDGADGWAASWDSGAAHAGAYSLSATAVDTAGQRAAAGVDVTTGTNQQGDWVGTYGQDGYALFAWTSTSDTVLLPQASLTVEQGARSSVGTTTDVRALESPDESERRVGAYFDGSQVRLRLTFSSAYSGGLHLYAVDWATVDRRQRFTVDDGSGAQVAQLSTSFNAGAWLHFPISVDAGGTVVIRVDRLAGVNALINGLFLGEGAPPPPPTTVPGAPTLDSADPGDGQVELSWTAPASDGGSPITGYTATASPGGATCSTSGATTCTVTGLTNGTAYSFTVTATNAVGTGPPSNELSATPFAPPSAPDAPRDLVASPHKARGISLSWVVPLSDGGSPLTGYRLYRGTSSGSWTLLVSVGNVTSYRDTSTKKGVRYYYVVTAINGLGEGPTSNEATAIAK